jgi:hypothetical protein
MPEMNPTEAKALSSRNQPAPCASFKLTGSPYLLMIILLAGLLVVGEGHAQTQGIPQLQPRQDQDNRTPAERQAENYDPRGVHVGGFLLFPTLELDELFDDNIYAASPSVAGKTSSFVQILKPSLELHSLWSQHMLEVYARGGFGFYSADASQNYQDIAVGADGRYDITRFANAYGGASYNRNHEALGTPNAPSGAFTLSQFNQITANAGYLQKFGRFRAQLDGRMDNYGYIDNGVGLAQGVLPNTDRNRTEFRENLRLGYEFLDGYEFWARGGLNQRTYEKAIDSQGFAHGSTGWDIVGGVAIALSNLTSIEVFAGYLAQDYSDARFTRVSTPTFGLVGYWSPLRELVVKPYVRRSVDDTALAAASGYLNTSGGLDVDYKYRPNIQLTGHADYTVADYQAVAGSSGRYDQYWTFRGGVLYLPTEHFFIGPTYQYVRRNSNQFGLGYDDNQILLRLGARL